MTEEALLDLYVMPEERLARFEYRGEELPEIITRTPRFFPSEKYDEKANKAYQVIAPLNIAESFEKEIEILPDTIGEYLLRAVRKKKSFP